MFWSCTVSYGHRARRPKHLLGTGPARNRIVQCYQYELLLPGQERLLRIALACGFALSDCAVAHMFGSWDDKNGMSCFVYCTVSLYVISNLCEWSVCEPFICPTRYDKDDLDDGRCLVSRIFSDPKPQVFACHVYRVPDWPREEVV